MEAPRTPEPWPVLPGYAIERELGEGAFGRVFQARAERLGRRVAVKVLKDSGAPAEVRARFVREARLLVGLRAEGLIPVLDAELDRDPIYLALPWMAGGDLAARIGKGPAPAGEVLATGLRLARGLAALHARGVIHRDIKPANVLLDEAGAAWLADLGLGRAEDSATLTRTGFLVGTPRYLSPEVLAGELQSRSNDVWALGVVLVELATGKVTPGMAAMGTALHEALARIEPRPLRQALAELVRTLPEDRPADGAAAVEALEAASAESEPAPPAVESTRELPRAVSARALPVPPRPVAPASSRWTRPLGATAAVAVLLAGHLSGPEGDPSGPEAVPSASVPPWQANGFPAEFEAAVARLSPSQSESLRDPANWARLLERLPGAAEFQAWLAEGRIPPGGLEADLAARLARLDDALEALSLPPVFGPATRVRPAGLPHLLAPAPDWGRFTPRPVRGWLATAAALAEELTVEFERLYRIFDSLSRGEPAAELPESLRGMAATLQVPLSMLRFEKSNDRTATMKVLWMRPEQRRTIPALNSDAGKLLGRILFAVGQTVRHEPDQADLAVEWLMGWFDRKFRVGAFCYLAYQEVAAALGGPPGSPAAHQLAAILHDLQAVVRENEPEARRESAARAAEAALTAMDGIDPAAKLSADRTERALYLLLRWGKPTVVPARLAEVWRSRIAPHVGAHPTLLSGWGAYVEVQVRTEPASPRFLGPLARAMLETLADHPGIRLPDAALAALRRAAAEGEGP